MDEIATDSVVNTPVEEPVALDPVNEAAMKFSRLLPYVKKMCDAMPSQKGLTRVLYAMAAFPLGSDKPKLLTEGERQLFHILYELQGYKSTVLQSFVQAQFEKEKALKEAQTAAQAEETKNVTSEN